MHCTYHTPFGNVSVETIGWLGPTSAHLVRYHDEQEYGGDFSFVCTLMKTRDEGKISGGLGTYTPRVHRALRRAFEEIGLKQINFIRLNAGRRRKKTLR